MQVKHFPEPRPDAESGYQVLNRVSADADADPQLKEAIAKLEYLTPVEKAYILDKGKAGVAKLPLEKLRQKVAQLGVDAPRPTPRPKVSADLTPMRLDGRKD